MRPMIGMMMSLTSESTILPKAAPMITPMARSTTLPRIANFLNSWSIVPSMRCQDTRSQTSKAETVTTEKAVESRTEAVFCST